MNSLDFIELPPSERAVRYRELAEEMRQCAARALTNESRIGYLDMAVGWLNLAQVCEAEYGKVSVTADPAFASLLQREAS